MNIEWKREVVDNGVNDLKTAVALSIAKWEYIVKNNGSSRNLLYKHPEMSGMVGNCGLCQLCHIDDSGYHDCTYGEDNTPCPLLMSYDEYSYNISCGMQAIDVRDKEHPWNIWYKNKTKENAQVMIDLIKAIDVENYGKTNK